MLARLQFCRCRLKLASAHSGASAGRGFEEDPDEMWRLQVAYGDPSLDQLRRARDYTQELRKVGKVRSRRRRKRPSFDED